MRTTVASLAFRANTFENEIGTLHQISFRQRDFRNGKVFKANGLATAFAVEMHMHVVVNSVVVAVAKFIAHTFTAFKHMDEMVLLEECQSAEDA